MAVRAIRGANEVPANQPEAIRAATVELMTAILERNGLAAGDLISCLFTLTDDLDAEFPAAAAREMGLDGVPLICAREIPVPGAMARVVRVLVHFEAADGRPAEHVYLGAAQGLRPDLDSAQ